jgi:hypothetical protein
MGEQPSATLRRRAAGRLRRGTRTLTLAAVTTARGRARTRMLAAGALAAVTTLAGALAAGGPAASAQTPARVTASFVPMRLGGRTTLQFGFSFGAPPGQVPPPLTGIELRYPANLGLYLTGLGLATCTVQVLEARGPGGCSPNSVMGYGEVSSGVVFGTKIVNESAPITIFRAPTHGGFLAVLFYAQGSVPVDARVIFPGLLLPSPSPFGGVVNIHVPLVETLPGAPYVSVLGLRSTIGPRKVVYYENVGGQVLGYRPKGILLPPHCPQHGFPFAARFTFTDGSVSAARTTIRCGGRGSAGRR